VIENAVTFVTFLLGLDGKGINTNAAMGKGRVAPRFTPIRTMDIYRACSLVEEAQTRRPRSGCGRSASASVRYRSERGSRFMTRLIKRGTRENMFEIGASLVVENREAPPVQSRRSSLRSELKMREGDGGRIAQTTGLTKPQD
jgi:hypothetical protein